MWVRLQLDFGWGDLAFGMSRLFHRQDQAGLANAIGKRWSPDGNAFPILSVRSGLDLFLQTMQWPRGSEIVYSALNIPDMTMVARHHGMVPVPADLDLDRLAPNLHLLEQAITPRTRAILVAHLYGNFVNLPPILEIARKHQLMLIEDCAENFDGVYTGHPDADVSLFSFGPLKTVSTLAGGVVRVKDADLCARLRANHDAWPQQSRSDYFNRLCKYGTMKFFGAKWIYGEVRRVAKLVVGDVDRMIHHTAKSFRDDEIMKRLRQRPSGALLAAMERRFAHFDSRRIVQRIANGRLLAERLRGTIFCPGADVEPHNYWLFPAIVSEPAKVLAALEAAGFDATQVQSMQPVAAPEDRPDLDPVRIREALAHMILIPCYPGMPESELCRMADVLIEVEKATSLVSALKVTLQPTDTMPGAQRSAAKPPASVESDLNAESGAPR